MDNGDVVLRRLSSQYHPAISRAGAAYAKQVLIAHEVQNQCLGRLPDYAADFRSTRNHTCIDNA